jgi:biopolymer transport protein ExbB/TolQ
MTQFFLFIKESGAVGWVIILTGCLGFAVILERAKVLFFDYALNVDVFSNQVRSYILNKKPEEALIFCSQFEKKPLAKALKTILEKSDRDDEALFQAHDIALSENMPLYSKRVHYLSMLANVATLLGLLGTIHGLILSFQAVAQADPAAKQAMLASGIAVSMYTTALGLAVAIPAMVFYSILTSKQNQLMDQMVEQSSKLTELLSTLHLPQLTKPTIFPERSSDAERTDTAVNPPPFNPKAS